jgi:hypothetical protein
VTSPRRDSLLPTRYVTGTRRDSLPPTRYVTSPCRDSLLPRRYVTSPRRDSLLPTRYVTGPRRDVTGPRRDVTGPRRDVTGPRRDSPLPTRLTAVSVGEPKRVHRGKNSVSVSGACALVTPRDAVATSMVPSRAERGFSRRPANLTRAPYPAGGRTRAPASAVSRVRRERGSPFLPHPGIDASARCSGPRMGPVPCLVDTRSLVARMRAPQAGPAVCPANVRSSPDRGVGQALGFPLELHPGRSRSGRR